MGLEQTSYKTHENSYVNANIDKEIGLYKNWFDEPTTDLWRHKRMLSVLNPFLNHAKNTNWLTVGDGRFGTSATYINKNGCRATASDIDTRLLEVAKNNNMISEYAYANAENLPFNDEHFDYSYCKLAYHHFPRPILAVYEMLRVSKHAVIYTEPNDYSPAPITKLILQIAKRKLKQLFGKALQHHDTGNFEASGNYIYNISVREFEKIAQGLGLGTIAYKYFHDVYIVGVEQEVFSKKAPLYKKIKFSIFITRIKTLLGLCKPNYIQMIIFKTQPSDLIITALKKDNYTIIDFPKNPYL